MQLRDTLATLRDWIGHWRRDRRDADDLEPEPRDALLHWASNDHECEIKYCDRVGGWELQGSGDTWVVCNTCYMAVELGASVAYPYVANSDPRPSRVTVVPGEPTRRKHVHTRE